MCLGRGGGKAFWGTGILERGVSFGGILLEGVF